MNVRNMGLLGTLALTGALGLGATMTQVAVAADDPVDVTTADDHDAVHPQMMESMPEEHRAQCDAQHALMSTHHDLGDGSSADHMGGLGWGGGGMRSGHMGPASGANAAGGDGHAAHHGDGVMGMSGVSRTGA